MSSVKFAWVVVVLAVSACQCGRQPPKQTLMKEGEACESDELCETGLCDAAPGFAPLCVRKCADGCSLGEVCVQLTPNRFACQPDLRKLCQPCNVDADCPYPSDKCLVVNNEKVCGRDCAFDQNCPTGYRCVNGQGVDGQPKVQQCVPTNASCACLARGDFQQACQVSNGTGTCLGIKQCDLVSNTVVCDARDPVAETCNGIDDDCDGQTDEDLPSTSCGVGACERQVSSCADGGVAVCMPGTPATETCNGLDDDCDGTSDDGFDTMTDVQNCGACGTRCTLANATPKCAAGTCEVDTCTGDFRNCNGLHPDGCEVNIKTDSAHCGACNNTCTRPNSSGTCVNGGCQFACTAPYKDLNGDPADGCEYRCPVWPAETTDLPDLQFVDANCDGIDGEVMNGIFVAVLGDDLNAGTRAAPKATLGAAISAAAQGGKRDVYVSEGTYAGPLVLNGTSGINVAGAYHPGTWQRSLSQVALVSGGNPALDLDTASNVLVQGLQFQGDNGTATKPSAYGAFIKESSGVKLEGLEVRAGNGRPGAPGQAGTAGRAGAPGAPGAEGCAQDSRSGDFATWCNLDLTVTSCWNVRPAGGVGGNSNAQSCGYPGGSGGQPSKQTSTSDSMSIVANGNNGLAAPQGTGAAGLGVPESTTPTPGSQYFGGAGQVGSAGTIGAAGALATFGATGAVLNSGGGGLAGGPGRGGGGGGGGAGGWVPVTGIAGLGNGCQGYGSAGGGGGEGGCGGTPGTGGTGGGASIGLYLFNASVSAQGVVVRTGNGGAGGAGGSGGSGGNGGAGGVSPQPPDDSLGTKGGNGGNGGAGGVGGHGGGGAGGSVYGMVKNGASTWNAISGTSFVQGTPGVGGASSGNAGPTGLSGVSTTF